MTSSFNDPRTAAHEISHDGAAELVPQRAPHPGSARGGSLSDAEQVAGGSSSDGLSLPDTTQDRAPGLSLTQQRANDGQLDHVESVDTEDEVGYASA